MALPIQKDIELPLLLEIEAMGGEAHPQDLYPRVTARFSQITEIDLRETITGGTNKWTNRIQWTRQALVSKQQLERYPRGVWKITEKGRERLRREGLKPLLPPPPPPLNRHEELKQKMLDIGNKLGYYTATEERGPVYQHDVLWKRGAYKRDPSHVIEICAGGSLPKDFDALNWAHQNVGARGVLVTVDEADYRKAIQRFENQPAIVVVKAETVDRLHELVMTDIAFLELIFGEKS